MKFSSFDPYMFLTPWEVSQVKIKDYEVYSDDTNNVKVHKALFDTPQGPRFIAVKGGIYDQLPLHELKEMLTKKMLEGVYEETLLVPRRVAAFNSTGRSPEGPQGTR